MDNKQRYFIALDVVCKDGVTDNKMNVSCVFDHNPPTLDDIRYIEKEIIKLYNLQSAVLTNFIPISVDIEQEEQEKNKYNDFNNIIESSDDNNDNEQKVIDCKLYMDRWNNLKEFLLYKIKTENDLDDYTLDYMLKAMNNIDYLKI